MKPLSKTRAAILSVFLIAAVTTPQDARSADPRPAPCGVGFVQQFQPQSLFQRASLRLADVPAGHVRVTFIGHSTFFIETSGGASVATDYNGFNVPPTIPDAVTMNRSHSTHYTDAVDPAIKHALTGWDPDGGIIRHHVQIKDLRIYNLPTNIFGTTNGNSVFVFEAGGICLAHLGHLHHYLSKEEIAQLGRIDVLFVPADGSVTLSYEEAMYIIDQIKPRLVIPMHYGSGGFAQAVGARYPVKQQDASTVVLNRASLPMSTEVLILGGYF